MIDVHVLLLGNENVPLLNSCLKSLENEPIVLHKCEGIIGDLQTARKNAIKRGTNDYIGWVDPDDEIIPGIYSKLLAFTPQYKFVWAKEEIRKYSDLSKPPYATVYRTSPHHIHIIHRDLIKDEYFDTNLRADVWTGKLMKDGKFLDEVGYIWNQYATSNAKRYYETTINKST